MRFQLQNITAKRIADAISRRLADLPSMCAWHFSPEAELNKRRLRKYHNIHNGERCFVIANGPSLKKLDLSPLKNEYTISMNRAYLLYDEWGFRPTYYACVNELVLEQFAGDIAALNMPKFLNFNRKKLFPKYPEDESVMFFRLGLGLREGFIKDVTREISSGGTVTFACLQLAHFLGFSEVILIGLDHNFAEKGIPNKTVVRNEDKDESHCHPGYFPKGIKWQLPDLYRSELAYSLAKEAYEADGRRIVDATVDGKCEIFEKVPFETILSPKISPRTPLRKGGHSDNQAI